MALVDIIEKINQEVKTKAEQLQNEFDFAMAELKKKHDQSKRDLKVKFESELESESAKVKEKTSLEAEIESKKILLVAKRQLIAEILSAAIDKLASSDQYQSIVTDMLKASNLDSGTEVVAAKGKEKEIEAALKASGKDYKMAAKSADIKGGIILKATNVEIDNSFETIINFQLKQQLEIDLHKLLFA